VRAGACTMSRTSFRFLPILVASTLTLGISTPSFPQAPDNTKTNQRDRAKSEPTADQAKNNLSDRQIMQKIRKAVVADKSLSTYAHNVKIIADHGKVTLKGPVHTDEEKKKIEAIAADVVGPGNVTNDIEVKGDKK
jgi:hyperosmotically inducible protein